MKYRVEFSAVKICLQVQEVEAENEGDVEEIAYKNMGNYPWKESDELSDIYVSSVEEIEEE